MFAATQVPGVRFSANGSNHITKRDGREEVFDRHKVVSAVKHCVINSLGTPEEEAEAVAQDISRRVETILVLKAAWPVGVEDVQRLVIQQLWANEHFAAAEQYQNYREEHRRARETRPIHPDHARAVAEDSGHFPTDLQYYQFVGKFARWREEDQRRETWREACDRVMGWFRRRPRISLTDQEWAELDASLYGLETCCAMRVLQMAGPALDRCNVGAYNCSYHPIQDIFAFAELLYILMQGTGSGFSVEHEYVGELPKVKRQRKRAKPDLFRIEDDTEAWCNALKFGMERWFDGYDVAFDDSSVRKAGTRLKTKGGRACLTGDTVVYKDRKKSTGSNTLTIAELYEKRLKTPRRLRHVKLRCLDEATGTFRRNRVVDVIDNGVADVYEVVTAAGYRIKATGNHRFMNADRVYQHLDLFGVGDLIAINGAEVKSGRCADCGVPVSRRARRCRPCADQAQIEPDANPTTARARKECQTHNVGVCAVCGRDDLATQVHHKDRNPLNNTPDNCLCVCEPCHRGLHAAEDTFGNPYAHRYLSFDRIVSVTYTGRERVYDLCMEAPNHNFVANGFVSHNSGPEPLRELLRFTRSVVLSRQGGVLTDLDCHDVCCVGGKIVQVGGVRRASCISISELTSQSMREAKSGNWYERAKWRTMANNSAAYDGRPDDVAFMREWLSLAESGSGERGIFNRKAVELSLPKRRKKGQEWGMNPCGEIILRPFQFCVGGDTPLITRSGLTLIGRAEGRQVEVWNGRRWSEVTVRKTGENQQLVRVHFSDGSHLDCTPDHRFSVNTADSRFKRGENVWREVKARDLRAKMATETFRIQYTGGKESAGAYTLGVLLGDGHLDRHGGHVYACVDLYGDKMSLPVLGQRGRTTLKPGYNVPCVRVNCGQEFLPHMESLRLNDEDAWNDLFGWDRRSILDFLAGWFDTDGSDTSSGGVRLYVSGRFRADMAQLLLTKCGIRSSVNLMSRAGDETNFGSRGADIWYVQVTDCGELPCHRLDVTRGHPATMKGKYQTVRSVEYLPGLHDTFCFTEPEEHKAVFNNTLTFQCNLSIAVARHDDTRETLRKKVRLAAYWGCMQKTCTDFRYIRPDWKKNCEEEALLGVDITGHADCPLLRYGAPGRAELLREFRRVVAEVDEDLSRRWGVNRSAADTCVKPGGDSSVFFDCASGVSDRYAAHQIRWVRESMHSPVAGLLIEEGVPHAAAPEDPSLLVFGFPRKAPEGSTLRNDHTAVQQLENWLEWKRNWAEHSVACTIYVAPHEWVAVGNWVLGHFDEVTGLSFLPKDNGIYSYAPNEEITREQYEEMTRTFPKINWAKLARFEEFDQTTSSREFACVGDRCGG